MAGFEVSTEDWKIEDTKAMSQSVESPDKSAPVIGHLTVVLLVAILATQLLILRRMPAPIPTLGMLNSTPAGDARMTLLQQLPLIRVQGGGIEASVSGTVEVEGTVQVEVGNTPLEVELSR